MMNEFKGTPGPWAIDSHDGTPHNGEQLLIYRPDDGTGRSTFHAIAEMRPVDGSLPDARLIAAAPELLAEVANVANRLGGWREVVAEIDDMSKNEALAKAMYAVLDQMDDARKTLRAAIAKALGTEVTA